MDKDFLKNLASEIRGKDEQLINSVSLCKEWNENTCNFTIHNTGKETVHIKEVVLFKGEHLLSDKTPFYGEGYSMLSQYGGTLGEPEDISDYSDRSHYKLPQTKGFFTAYNMLILFPENENIILLAFSSCRRFASEFRFNGNEFEIVMNLEGMSISEGECVELEEFCIIEGQHRDELLEILSHNIEKKHPRLNSNKVPTGWCSWYYYGPDFEEKDIYENLKAISEKVPELKYIQIDDGYQAWMGDWLIPGSAFSGGVQSICHNIKSLGYEPAIWVAPFIAEAKSKLFQEHKDWFIKDEKGNPLSSDLVTFAGWRCAPWYMLDGSHPGAQKYLRDVFRTMKEEWKCHYFKLDANMWGAMPFGKHYDPKATSIEAYRLGMQAVLEGAGEDSFILGCNAPMWPSLGTVHGMRVTGDILRSWDIISGVAKEGFWRNWQHRRLWINDPDCIVLSDINRNLIRVDGTIQKISQSVSTEEYSFHAAYILATGGMVLSGDRICELNDEKIKMLQKLLPAVDRAAVFDDTSFTVGRTYLDNKTIISLFNWDEQVKDIELILPQSTNIKDFWTGADEDFVVLNDKVIIKGLKPHSAKVIEF